MYDVILTVHWAALSGLWDSRSSMSSSRDSLDLLQTAPSIDEDDSDVPTSPFDDDADGGSGMQTTTPDSLFTQTSPFERRRFRGRGGGLNRHPRNATSMPEMMQAIGQNHAASSVSPATAATADQQAAAADASSSAASSRLADGMERVWGADKVEVTLDNDVTSSETNGHQKQDIR